MAISKVEKEKTRIKIYGWFEVTVISTMMSTISIRYSAVVGVVDRGLSNTRLTLLCPGGEGGVLF